MRTRMGACLMILILALMITITETSVVARTPGEIQGNINNDPFWSAEPGWCCVMEEDDINETTWWTGITVYNISYRENPGDGWDRYITELTIPYVGIRMYNGDMIRYEYSQETSLDHIYFNGQSYTIHSYSEQEPWTSISVDYVLNADGDSDDEWKFMEYVEFQPPSGENNGYFKIEFQVSVYPQFLDQNKWYWGNEHTNVKVHLMEIPFMINPDVYANGANNFYNGSSGSSWTRIHNETTIDGSVNDAMVENDLPNPDVELIFTPIPQGCNPVLQNFTFLRFRGNEYSLSPAEYDNDEGMEGLDGLIWYVETYNVQQNPPPNAANGGTTGIKCEGFVA